MDTTESLPITVSASLAESTFKYDNEKQNFEKKSVKLCETTEHLKKGTSDNVLEPETFKPTEQQLERAAAVLLLSKKDRALIYKAFSSAEMYECIILL